MDDLPKPPNNELIKQMSVESWRMFRILSEFVDGVEMMINLGPSVSFFGSARTKPGHPHYETAVEAAKKIAEKGFAIITGGGPGIMEAANKGAKLAKGTSCGLSIDLPMEYKPNEFVDDKHDMRFRHFFVRKVMFLKYSQAFVVLPGGFGTLDELFEALNLFETNKSQKFPIYLIGKSYWEGLYKWIEETVLAQGNISKGDKLLMTITDDLDMVANGIEEHYLETKNIRNF